MINLFFMNPVSYGGHLTYTVHLMRGLRAAGCDVALYKYGNRTEGFDRKFGYDEVYRNIGKEDVRRMCENGVVLITATGKPLAAKIDEMLQWGARIVIHDPAEFKQSWNWQSVERPIVIRKSMFQYFDNAVFIKHPYDPKFSKDTFSNDKIAGISISRIDFDKHTEIILDANRLLPKKRKISIRGFENRIYTRFNIVPKYPEWVQSQAAYPKELRYAVDLCNEAAFMVDMSVIKGDGGGTQYTFLEAIDAGACCILNDEWIIKGHAMKPNFNCLSVSTGKALAALVKLYYKDQNFQSEVDAIRSNAKKLLNQHRAKTIANAYIEEFNL